MRRIAGLFLALFPLVSSAAPVPTHLMGKPEVQLRFNPASHPLGHSFGVAIRNTGGAELQVWTDRPSGIATFLDAEIRNEKEERISPYYAWNSPADADAVVRLAKNIPAGNQSASMYNLFQSVEEKSLLPGKYKLRVRFRYRDHDVVSNWVSVEVTELHIRTKHIVLGP